jgi:hypothetical protein
MRAVTFSLTEAMKRLGRPVIFYPALAQRIGIKEAIVLAQFVYWTPRSKNEQGWIYKSAFDLEEETSLTYKEQCRVRKTLRKLGLIQERLSREEHRLYFRVVPDAIDKLIPEGGAPDQRSDAHLTKGQMPPDLLSGGTLQKVSSNRTEITSENTSENIAARIEDAKHIDAAEEPVQQHKFFLESLKKKTSRPATSPAWAKDDLAIDLYHGIHGEAIRRAFFDARFLGPNEQLKNCIAVAVTSLVTSRVATLKSLPSDEIERRVSAKLLPSLATLSAVKNFPDRQGQVVRAVERVTVETCLQMLKAVA